MLQSLVQAAQSGLNWRIVYTAVDASGAAYGYSGKPFRDTHTTWSVRETGCHSIFLGYVTPPINFKETLVSFN